MRHRKQSTQHSVCAQLYNVYSKLSVNGIGGGGGDVGSYLLPFLSGTQAALQLHP